MREDFIHYLWRLARFDLRELTTTTGEPIRIQHFGLHNVNAGPDFSSAKINIGGINWAGNVEMHLKSSEWYEHNHQEDRAYDNVILHVVLEEDRPVFRPNGERIPCLELRGRIPSGLVQNYWRLLHNESWIPCQNQLNQVPEITRNLWLDRLLANRLNQRGTEMYERLKATNRDWEELFYQSLARSLGGKINSDAMDMLARSLPLRVILKHKHSLLQLEALLFGQAGLIPTATEEMYPQQLAREYKLLATKHQLTPLPPTIWRYLRLRPANFPEVRIAQLARLLAVTGQLFGKTLAAANVSELENMYDVSLSNYWQNHYRFGRESKRSVKRLGKDSVRSILVNTVAPAYYLYGKLRDNGSYQTKALELLEALPPEKNLVLTNWENLGMKATDAGRSQALLELKKNFCSQKRCLDCSIGCAILRNNGQNIPVLTVNEEAVVYALTGS